MVAAKSNWLDPTAYSPHWVPRSVKALSLLGDAKSVCDLGCGAPQAVRGLLPEGIRYLPADLKAWTSDTEPCDLAAGFFPEKSLAACDLCLMLGIIEYIPYPKEVFAGLALRCKRLITSYHPAERRPDRYETWVNSLSEKEYFDILKSTGWTVVHQEELDDGQVLYELRV